MTDPDPDPDMLAAEYVLGTLDPAERAAAALRTEVEPDFARAVLAWEDRLAPLVDHVPEVEPPARAYELIATRLFGRDPRLTARTELRVATDGVLRRLRMWRGATAGLAFLSAALLAWIALRDREISEPRQRFEAVLRDASAPAMLVDVDLASRSLTVRALDAEAPRGRAYELWIIDPALGAPRSLGVVPARGEARRSLSAYAPAVIESATYAVTVEPAGGSPTGQPSAAPVMTGRLSDR